MIRIERDDLSRPEVIALIELHFLEAHAKSPPGSGFALDLSGLRHPALTLWTMWDDDRLAAMGALRELDAGHGEVKSMRTAPDQLRRGRARAMLDHLIAEARARGYRRLSLETGGNDQFAPARAMYRRAGFDECGPFADYTDTGFSRYFTMAL